MKNTIGIITLLLISQSGFAEEIETNAIDANQVETQLIESDAAAIETAPASMSTDSSAAMEEQSGFSRGSVVRSAFTRDVDQREPTENLQNLTNENGEVKFFTELRDMSGQTAVHRWEYDGKVVAEIEFNVKGPRWRVWSSKSLVPQWTGDWKVSVINGAGEVISEKNLSYDVATAPIAPTETPETNSNIDATTAPAENEAVTAPESMQ
ncbi:MAG: DUF2914 domain-containing protein [Gammaproteobacteria bacterium]|nr:DUF2914 domain-containing protein [Gammaproteobacteria bacterium]MCW8988051.1 DUF2914 domain-containing protein [Gammaproteobacteria bacterium]MCW9031125.1 DUF2914 domain-containing protein [Gammaproteobacteria bacterium]